MRQVPIGGEKHIKVKVKDEKIESNHNIKVKTKSDYNSDNERSLPDL